MLLCGVWYDQALVCSLSRKGVPAARASDVTMFMRRMHTQPAHARLRTNVVLRPPSSHSTASRHVHHGVRDAARSVIARWRDLRAEVAARRAPHQAQFVVTSTTGLRQINRGAPVRFVHPINSAVLQLDSSVLRVPFPSMCVCACRRRAASETSECVKT